MSEVIFAVLVVLAILGTALWLVDVYLPIMRDKLK
jgi:hypothetical protein